MTLSARPRYRSAALVVVLLASLITGVNARPAATEEPEEHPKPEMVHQEGYDVKVERPPELLPRERGPAQDKYFDISQMQLPIPDPSALKALDVPGLLPPIGSLVPPLDLDALTSDLPIVLPNVDLSTIEKPVSDLLDTATSAVSGLQEAITALAAAPSTASTQQAMMVPPADFTLTTVAAGLTQTFTLTLCVPTPVNITSTNQTVPTTVVSLCPVPLAFASAVLLPTPGQPLQLYLSIQRIVGTSMTSASFTASYQIPSFSGPPMEVRFKLDSGSSAYPNNGVVGAATDYNPATTNAAEHLTLGWAFDLPVASVSTEAVGLAKVEISASPMPPESGSFALSHTNGRFTSQMTRTTPPLPGSNPHVYLSAPVPNTSGSTFAVLDLSSVPQNFTFNVQPTMVNARPTGISFDGSQTAFPSLSFSVQLDFITNNVLSGRLQQSGFGSEFSESIQTTQDEEGNITGASVRSSPGALSTLALYDYRSGPLGMVVELVDIPAAASEFTFQLKGAPGAASIGATLSGSNTPAFVGAMSFYTSLIGGSVSGTPQVSLSMATGASLSSSPPEAISQGVQMSLAVSQINPTFKIEMESITATSGNTTGVSGLEISGSSPGSTTAQQIVIEAQADPSTRVRLLMNSLGTHWDFKANLHGTIDDPTGLDVSDANAVATPAEYKQVHVTQKDAGGTYQPIYTFVIQRPGSNASGAAAPASKHAVVHNPPQSFDISFDYAANNAGDSCTQALNIQGSGAEATSGYVSLSADDLSLTISNIFVTGHWAIGANASGPSITCKPDTFSFHMHQDAGGNPAGVLTATQAGEGRMVLESFATTTNVTVQFLQDALGNPAGARIDANNSEPNPTQQIHLEQFDGATTNLALNIWASSSGTVRTGTLGTAILANVPQVFGIGLKAMDEGTSGTKSIQLNSYNPAPAPSETFTVTGPASFLNTAGSYQFVVRSFDVSTELKITIPPQQPNGFQGQVHSSNVNPNLTHVVSATLYQNGSPAITALMYRPNADLSGLPTSGSVGTVLWRSSSTWRSTPGCLPTPPKKDR